MDRFEYLVDELIRQCCGELATDTYYWCAKDANGLVEDPHAPLDMDEVPHDVREARATLLAAIAGVR